MIEYVETNDLWKGNDDNNDDVKQQQITKTSVNTIITSLGTMNTKLFETTTDATLCTPKAKNSRINAVANSSLSCTTSTLFVYLVGVRHERYSM
mmetsp:Transcript_7002/g.8724  ORF Transcript_7002/g.8724 Transcript_7002/m.8724 type:complete len:94 (-) Transcript_7002:15-296(-)